MSKKYPAPRASAETFRPYVPGRSIEEVKSAFGLDKIVKLASNENLWGTSEKVRNAVSENLDELNIYPLPFPFRLADKLAAVHSVDTANLIFSNGTDELIELLGKVFLDPGDNIVVPENSFVRYKMAAMLMGAYCIETHKDKGLKTDIISLSEAVNSSTKIIFIDNPCNPTGTFIKGDEIIELLDILENKGFYPLIVIDEAYFEYAKDPSYVSGIEIMKASALPVMVMRTFSKIYGLAALRIGYGIADEYIIGLLNRIKPPFNTNMLAQAAAYAALDDMEFLKRVSDSVAEEKEYIYNELNKLKIAFIRSETNFILIHLPGTDISDLCRKMLEKGIILRPLDGYSLPEYIRVTVGKREDNDIFLKYLKEFMTEI